MGKIESYEEFVALKMSKNMENFFVLVFIKKKVMRKNLRAEKIEIYRFLLFHLGISKLNTEKG